MARVSRRALSACAGRARSVYGRRMRDDAGKRLRDRMAAEGVDVPAELVEVIVAAAGPMITALDDLAALPLDDLEPFVPARRLPDDAR
jgi:hypothetical protein